jgi:hypothetical protein
MFDPSKLDLDLDENLEKKSKQTPKTSESDKISESKKPVMKKEVVASESNNDSDLLGNLLDNDGLQDEANSLLL